MNVDDRKSRILNILKERGTVKVAALSKEFKISEVTIRNYLTDMESKGLLTRVHGGAISSYKPYYSMNFNQRMETNHQRKDKIAEKIAEIVEPDDTIMMNSGTTTLLTFRKLPADYNLNIITNSISIALEASINPHYNVVLLGGSINEKYQFTHGDDAINQLKKYHADKFIISVDGIDFKRGFSTYYREEAPIDRAMAEQSDICIVAADSSKFRRNALVNIFDLDNANFIITDCDIDETEKKLMRENEINIVNVDKI